MQKTLKPQSGQKTTKRMYHTMQHMWESLKMKKNNGENNDDKRWISKK